MSEPLRKGLQLDHEHDRSLRVLHGGGSEPGAEYQRNQTELLRYVYAPWDQQLESPRPYFHPIRTLGGHVVSLYRPHDHVWHKGIAWSLPNVGTENFWGGVTFRRGEGYVQLPNNGATVHRGFDALRVDDDRLTVREQLDWVTEAGATWFSEQRWFTVSLLADAWLLGYGTTFTNVSGSSVTFGSPTTEGRPNAGYGGLFWRGPRSFTGGTVHTPGRTGGDDLMGTRAPWLALSGRHDEDSGASTLVFVDSDRNPYPGGHDNTQWFVRSTPFAAVCPAPFFDTEVVVPEGDSLSYEYAVIVADDDRGPDGSAALAGEGQAVLPELRPTTEVRT